MLETWICNTTSIGGRVAQWGRRPGTTLARYRVRVMRLTASVESCEWVERSARGRPGKFSPLWRRYIVALAVPCAALGTSDRVDDGSSSASRRSLTRLAPMPSWADFRASLREHSHCRARSAGSAALLSLACPREASGALTGIAARIFALHTYGALRERRYGSRG